MKRFAVIPLLMGFATGAGRVAKALFARPQGVSDPAGAVFGGHARGCLAGAGKWVQDIPVPSTAGSTPRKPRPEILPSDLPRQCAAVLQYR